MYRFRLIATASALFAFKEFSFVVKKRTFNVERKTFKELFCETFQCPPEKYEARALRRLLHDHAKFLLLLPRRTSSSVFRDDFKLLRDLGEAVDFREVAAMMDEFRLSTVLHRNLLRRTLKIRLSGRKIIRLAGEFFGASES